MKKTEMVFILDKSGSISGLEDDTIGGYNSMLKKQQKEEGQAIVTTALLDAVGITINKIINATKNTKKGISSR